MVPSFRTLNSNRCLLPSARFSPSNPACAITNDITKETVFVLWLAGRFIAILGEEPLYPS
jgi:hypothetical protein